MKGNRQVPFEVVVEKYVRSAETGAWSEMAMAMSLAGEGGVPFTRSVLTGVHELIEISGHLRRKMDKWG